jgi:dTDP-4-amino-4,6-dideoxygalactose transaminase
MVRFVDLGRQYQSIKAEVDAAIAGVFERTAFILGEPVASFEREFAAYCEAKHCIGVANGTDALQIALAALDVGSGDEVIVPANTFIATALGASHLGAKVVPVDVDPVTNLMTAETLETAITPRTKVVIPVHLFGKPVDIDPILKLCAAKNIRVLEDTAQAHGARYKGKRVGGLGDISAFSFYPGKNLGAYGDGGAIVTNDDALAQRVRLFRDLGQQQKYVHVLKGYNSRLVGLQAAVLSVKLRKLDGWNERRRELAGRYDAAFVQAGIKTNSVSPGEAVFHLYCIEVDDRERVMKSLDEEKIGYGIHYPTPIHLHDAYRDLGYGEGSFPVSEAWSKRTLSLPMFAEMTDDELDRVVEAVKRAVAVPV